MDKQIVYIGDPVCSWCYAFTDTFEKIKKKFDNQINFSYLMGGLVINRDIKIDRVMKRILKKNWEKVETKTGKYIKAIEKIDCIEEIPYTSEPACKAFISIKSINQEKAYSFYKLIHRDFYENLNDISTEEVLCENALKAGITKDIFLKNFKDKKTEQKMHEDIKKAKDLGVKAFPALVAIEGSKSRVLNQGFKNYNLLEKQIKSWIDNKISVGDMLPVL
ncbi:MAG: hypothetical protein CSB21_02695 [Deltaproteobacteria bacterium]|nr:MAG: hypothetical protein CSB21_02695 [Deltaproteobacteria bacterium]